MTTITGFSREEMIAIEEFLRSCCVPLVSDENGKLAIWGTGTFYRHGSSLCLVTAAHILQDVRLQDLAVPELGTGLFTTFGNCIAHYPKQDDSDLDVAVIRLQDEEFVARMTPYWRVMDRRNVERPTSEMKRFVVAGYPLEIVQRKIKPLRDRQTITRDAFSQFYAHRFSGVVPGSNPAVDLYLTYGRRAYGLEGEEKRTPDLGAVSGASIWAIQDKIDGIWAPEKLLRIVAVQSGFKHDEYIETKTWELVDQVLLRSG